MDQKIILAFVLHSVAQLMLLISTHKMVGIKIRKVRMFISMGFGLLYCIACISIPVSVIGDELGRLLSILITAIIAFGGNWHGCAVFILLSLAFIGIAPNMDSIWLSVLGAVIVASLSVLGFRNGYAKQYLPVILRHNDKSVVLTALFDSGNTLRDPVTGQPVLVVAAEVAEKLIGVKKEDLRVPYGVIGRLPGSRLVPFRAVGCENGLMLAVRIRDVSVGNWRGSCLVAFAPNGLGAEKFQALVGGTL